VKIRYKKNGFIGDASEAVAKKLIDKDAADLVDTEKTEDLVDTEKTEDPKPKAKKVTVR